MTSMLSGFHDMAFIAARVGGSVDAGVRQDWLSLGFNIGAMAGKYIWYRKSSDAALKKLLETVGKEFLPTPTAILDVAMVVVAVIDLLNGFGDPNKGEGFEMGRALLKAVDGKLENAYPDSRDWSGDAADAYVAQLNELRDIVADMQDVDKLMKDLIAEHGLAVKQQHLAMTIMGFALVMAQGVAIMLYNIPLVGAACSLIFQVVTAIATAAAVAITEAMLAGNSQNRGQRAEVYARDYIALGKRAELAGTFGVIEVAGAEETRVGSFTAISESMSAYSAVPPTISSLAKAAGTDVTDDQQAVLDGLSEDEIPTGTPTDDTPAAPVDEPTDEGRTFTSPTLAQVSQVTGQIGKISNDIAQPLGIAQQTMGSVQSLVQTASQAGQQGQQAATSEAPDATDSAEDAPAAEPAPAAAEAAPVGVSVAGDGSSTDHAGAQFGAAAAGSGGGERAPVGAPTDGTPADGEKSTDNSDPLRRV